MIDLARGPTHDAPPPTPWGWILGGWTAFGLFNAAQYHVAYQVNRGIALPWWIPVLLQLPVAWTWALATPLILRLGERFPLERGRRARSLAVHVPFCLGLIAVTACGYALHLANVMPAAAPPRPLLQRTVTLFLAWVIPDGLIYSSLLTARWALERQRRLRERERRAGQLETQLAQARLHALKMQLHPHFLFNALHTIGSLVRTGDRENAVRVVADLGDLLRRLLDDAAQQEVPLAQELDFVAKYLAVEQVRFRDRLRVRFEVADEVLDASVPHLILQPLVENALRHGIGPHRSAGQLVITARRAGDRLHLAVIDDGPPPVDEVPHVGGIGLANTRARLTHLYGGDYVLERVRTGERRHEARVVVPWRVTTTPATEPAS